MKRALFAGLLSVLWAAEATAGNAGGDAPGLPCGGVATACRPPIQLATRSPTCIVTAPPIHQPPIQVFRKEHSPPAFCEAKPRPPIQLHPHCPCPVEIVTLCRPTVDFLVIERKPPEYTCLPERSPLQMFQRIFAPPEAAPTICLPGIQLYQRPCSLPPAYGCCIPCPPVGYQSPEKLPGIRD